MMDYYTVFGMMVVALIAIIGIFISIRKSIADERRPMDDLNANIVRLNANFEHMIKQDEIRDERLKKHGVEIETLDEKVHEHDKRISVIESKVKE